MGMAADGIGGRGRRPPSIRGLERFSFVGQGGKAVVWRAWETAFNRQVAVKLLFQYDDERALRRFERECVAVGSIDHPNIVSVHRTGVTDDTGSPYLQMEYLPKGSLADSMHRGARMSWREGVAIGVKLAGALATAHERGVLHRDIKPENVLFTSFSEPKLADFGIARVMGGTLSNTTVYDLTPDYAAPEVARLWIDQTVPETAAASFPADVYGLAVTVFAVLYGRPPFSREGDNAITVLHRVPSEPVPDLRPTGVPDEVCAVLERGMAKDPQDRPQSAHQFGEELRQAEARLGLSRTVLPFIPVEHVDEHVDTPPPPPPPPPSPPPPPPSPAPPPPAPMFLEPETVRVAAVRPAAVRRRLPGSSPRRGLKVGILLLALVGVAFSVPSIADLISSPTTSTSSSLPTTSVTSSTSSSSTTTTTSSAQPKLLTLPSSGPLAAGRYSTGVFVPKVTFSVGDGWAVDDASSADRVVLTRREPTETITLMRVQRIYNSQAPLATKDDALNAVQDVRDLPRGLADWLLSHPQRRGESAITPVQVGATSGNRVDAQFAPYDYEGCGTPQNKCVPLFQLYGADGQTFAFARVESERVRFDVFDVQNAKVVVAASALVGRFDAFVRDLRFSLEAFEPTDRLASLRVRSTPNPSRENETVALSAEVSGPCTAGRVVFSDIPVPEQKKTLGSAPVVNGAATLREPVTFALRGQDRIVAEYDGADCAKSISAPLVHRVT